jgi:pyrrolidone-carboxylate peptidase
MDRQHWLITAFDPFLGRAENTSKMVLDEIARLSFQNQANPDWPFEFHFATLPVSYDQCFPSLLSEVENLRANGVRLQGILSMS